MLVLKRESISFISYLNLECIGLVVRKKFTDVLGSHALRRRSLFKYVRSGFTLSIFVRISSHF